MNISVQIRISADGPCEKQMEVPEDLTYDELLGLLSINQETVIVSSTFKHYGTDNHVRNLSGIGMQKKMTTIEQM